jgi:K(+)-stimulated pyrophosphate-energized sodium pump
MSWFSHHAVLFALLCAAAAVVYGLWLTSWLLGRPAGTERMQEIAHAVQEGAAAYLRRQYTTIACCSASTTSSAGAPRSAS